MNILPEREGEHGIKIIPTQKQCWTLYNIER